ncbi:hypothetical protein [Streptomyces sp. NPDC048419]|uniref:hypothetical protein n=1 Tax=Streptomyces sp. NPDC048419 TaxID=3365547 RepID=UPI00371A0056
MKRSMAALAAILLSAAAGLCGATAPAYAATPFDEWNCSPWTNLTGVDGQVGQACVMETHGVYDNNGFSSYVKATFEFRNNSFLPMYTKDYGPRVKISGHPETYRVCEKEKTTIFDIPNGSESMTWGAHSQANWSDAIGMQMRWLDDGGVQHGAYMACNAHDLLVAGNTHSTAFAVGFVTVWDYKTSSYVVKTLETPPLNVTIHS